MWSRRAVSMMVCVMLVVCVVSGMCLDCYAYSVGYDGLGPVVLTGGMRDMIWPVPDNYNIQSCFYDHRNHLAIDISANKGTTIVAAYDGKVIAVEKTQTYASTGYGNYVVVEHTYELGTGETVILYTKYNHMSLVSSNVGDTVTAGTSKLGEIGSTGYSEGNHLDFQVFYGDWTNINNSIDPYANQLMELPVSVQVYDSWTCGPAYLTLVKEVYNTPLAYSRKNVEIPSNVSPSNLQLKITSNKSVPIRVGAGKTFAVVDKLENGDTVTALGYLRNKHDNLWYFLSDGTYVYSGNVEVSKCLSTARITNQAVPGGNLAYGSIFVLKGTISGENVCSITVRIKDSNGNMVLTASEKVNGEYSLQGSSIDKAMTFNTLPRGNYVYEIVVTENGDTGVVCTRFDTMICSSNFTIA